MAAYVDDAISLICWGAVVLGALAWIISRFLK